MLFIPLPLLLRLSLPWKQKAVLFVIFSMGTFVILAAILTKVFNLSDVWDPSYMLWYTRESSVAVYVSNLPMIWPLMREWFPALRKLTPGYKVTSSRGRGYSVGGRGKTTTTGTRSGTLVGKGSRTVGGGFGGEGKNMVNGITTVIRAKDESVEELGRGEEMEMGSVMHQESWDKLRPSTGHGADDGSVSSEKELVKGGIHMSTTVHVSEEHVEESSTRSKPLAFGNSTDVEHGHDSFDWDFKKERS